MSFFNSMRYPTKEHNVSELELKRLVSRLVVRTIDSKEEQLIEAALLSRRGGDGKISLQQIYEVLHHLRNQNQISRYDEEDMMKVCLDYFNANFKD